MSRLWVRLTLAFGLVILITVVSVALLSGLTAGREFRIYVRSSGMMQQSGLTSTLADYYRQHGSWQGVGSFIDQLSNSSAMMPGGTPGMRGGSRGMGAMMGGSLQIILADANGQVVYDSAGGRLGRHLSRADQASAQNVSVNNQVVGRLVLTKPLSRTTLGPLEQSFLSRLQRLLVAGALVAGALGLLLGMILSRSLSAPLRRLAVAARAVAASDFSQRVPAGGSTEIEDVAHAFNEMVTSLEQAEQQRQNLVADVAHELRTPLSVVQGGLRAILDDVYPLDKAEISRLYDETRLLSRLVDDLRELAQADAGQLHLNLLPADATQVARSTVDSLSPAAEAEGITLSVEAASHLPAVLADPDRLAQVLRNLIVNALRHTPQGGSVRVSVDRPDAQGPVEIAVADTGEGITSEDLPHVFDRFWRANRARTRDGSSPGGSGLGLSIARSLIEAQGGRLWAESVPGQGATFRLTLPVVSGPTVQPVP